MSTRSSTHLSPRCAVPPVDPIDAVAVPPRLPRPAAADGVQEPCSAYLDGYPQRLHRRGDQPEAAADLQPDRAGVRVSSAMVSSLDVARSGADERYSASAGLSGSAISSFTNAEVSVYVTRPDPHRAVPALTAPTSSAAPAGLGPAPCRSSADRIRPAACASPDRADDVLHRRLLRRHRPPAHRRRRGPRRLPPHPYRTHRSPHPLHRRRRRLNAARTQLWAWVRRRGTRAAGGRNVKPRRAPGRGPGVQLPSRSWSSPNSATTRRRPPRAVT